MLLVRTFVAIAFGALVASEAPAQSTKVHRIGVLANTVPTKDLVAGTSTHPAILLLMEGLREYGWIPGKNIEMVWRSAEGDYDRHPQQARELAQNCDMILVYAAGLLPAMDATKTIPIVMVTSGATPSLKDSAGNARIASFSRPGGNVTGLTLAVGPEILGKRLELVKTVLPRAKRVAILSHYAGRIGPRTRKVAETLALDVVGYAWGSELDKLGPAFEQMSRDGVDAVFVDELPTVHLPPTQKAIHALAEQHRMVVIHEVLAAADSGGLMAYGHDINKLYKRGTYFIDRILRGAKPGDIPIEQPADYELRVNLKAAKAIGLTVPQTVILQATRVFE